ncbi:MAG: helix-turn-helix domain-containing protein [Clostridia bacterium]|nr:helix-turn-helix domain-containing protein [Clostridia bacterium]
MKMRIAENIKTLRKQHSFTQEQLSEALGVTVSAVYKWESGQSVPEVKMLMELADLFEISVDTLLGYDRQNENIENRIKRIGKFVAERDFDEALVEAKKALKKYPNNFNIVYTAANVYMIIFSDKKDKRAMNKAIELFYSAIPLLYQNKENSINEASILNLIGGMYISAEQTEKGLEILKKNNVCGINNATIGLTYARLGKTDEAKNYLYLAYSDNINSTFRMLFGMMLMYAEGKSELYLEAGNVLVNYLDNLVVDKEKVTFIDKLKALIFAQLAIITADFGKYDEAEKNISIAHQYAIRFDSTPSYSPQDIKFIDGTDLCAVLADGSGEGAVGAIENLVFEKTEPGEALDFVKNRFAELMNK